MRSYCAIVLVPLATLSLATACSESDSSNTTTGGDADATTGAPETSDDTTDADEDTAPEGETAEDAAEVAEDAVNGSTAGQGGPLVILQWQAPQLANPYQAAGTKDLLASSLVLEPLAEIAPDGSIVPALAAEIPTQSNGGISEDLTKITWKLRDGVVWSDGSPLTADDVVFTWEYCSNEETRCTADFAFSEIAGVEAEDDLTVTVTFGEPTPYPFNPFVSYVSPIIQRAQFEDCVGAAALTCTAQNLAPIGTGPYKIIELRPEESVSYEHNPRYRLASEGKPFFGTIEIRGGGDAESTARAVLESGEADYAWNLQVAPEILASMEDKGNGRVGVGFATAVEHLSLNQTDPSTDPPSDYAGGANPHPVFFENEDLHRALSMAIDRDEIVAVGYGANGAPTCNMWVVGAQSSTNNDWCLTQDIAGANALLDESGYLDTDEDGVRETPGGLPLAFEFVTSTNAVRQSTQELIKGYWEQIGVDVTMRDIQAFIFFDFFGDESIWKFPSDIQMFTNGAGSPDPVGYLVGWTSDEIPEAANDYGGSNIVRLASDEYDELFEQLESTPLDDPGRDALVIQLNDVIVRYSTIPLVNRGSASAIANSIHGTGDLNGWDSEYWNVEDWTRAE